MKRPDGLDLDSHGAAVFNHHAVRVDAGTNREIHAMTCRRKIADRRRHVDAVAPVARPWTDTGGIGIVVVPDLAVFCRARSLEEGAIEGLPRFGGRPLDTDRSANSMKVAACVAIVLELAMERKDFLEAPFEIAPRRPFVEVLRSTAKRDVALTAELPPVTLPRGYGISRSGVACAAKPQSCGPAEIQVFNKSAGVCSTVE